MKINNMNIYLLFALLGGVLSGLTETINKNITEKKYSVFSYSLLQWGGNLLFYLLLFFINKEVFPSSLSSYFSLLIVVLFAFIGNIFIIKAYKTEDVSNINIIWRISLVVNFLNGYLLLSERISYLNLLGIFLILLGIIVIFYNGKSLHLSSGFIFALSGGICFGMVAYLNKITLSNFSPVAFLVAANIAGTTFALFMPKALAEMLPILRKYSWKILLSRFTSFIAYLLFIYAIAREKISVVNTNYETLSLLSVVILGIFFLKEKSNFQQKLAGSLFCTLGIILLNFF